MSNREEPGYQEFEGICRECGKIFTYHNSVRRHPDHQECIECEECEAKKIVKTLTKEMADFTYLCTIGLTTDIYGFGSLRVGIDRNTGKQIMGYVATGRRL